MNFDSACPVECLQECVFNTHVAMTRHLGLGNGLEIKLLVATLIVSSNGVASRKALQLVVFGCE